MENENITENLEPQGESEITEPEKSLSLKEIQDLIVSEKSLKSWLDSEKDKHASKVMKTYRENGNFEKDFQKYAIENGLLPDPNKTPSTPEEIEHASEIEKKLEKLESDTRRNDRTLQMMGMLDKSNIKGWNTDFIERLVKEDSTDEFEMSKIVSLLSEFDEMCRNKAKESSPQVKKDSQSDDEDMLSKSEFLDLPYKERIALLVSDKRYKNI